jgi:exodeoxyribonuclease-5
MTSSTSGSDLYASLSNVSSDDFEAVKVDDATTPTLSLELIRDTLYAALEDERWKQYYGGITLTKTQKNIVVTCLLRFSERSEQLIIGPAGTGKTTVLSLIIFIAKALNLKFTVVTPTHKASNVIRHNLAQILGYDRGVRVSTLHSLLNLKPSRQEPGVAETFKQSFTTDVGEYDFVIIDEVSMIGASLYKYIKSDIVDVGVPVLYCGDPYQLQPINEPKKSETFKVPDNCRYTLTEVVRHGGPILALATSIRKNRNVMAVRPASDDCSSIITHSNVRLFTESWTKKLHSNESEATILLTYTNSNRRRYNDIARKALFGPDVPRFQAGDEVLTLAAYERGGKMLFANNQLLTIIKAEFMPSFVPVRILAESSNKYAFNCWELTTLVNGEVTSFLVLDDNEQVRYKSALSGISRSIKIRISNAQKGGKVSNIAEKGFAITEQRQRWRTEFFPLKEAFASVDFPYALTIHKSQGSTFRNVFLHNDYLNSFNERCALQYVAVTRAAKELHHVIW